MNDLIVPTIGSRGFFELKPPMDTYIKAGERYTCKAIRSVNDYLANNENIKLDIYTHYKLTDSEYNDDIKNNMLIVSLQSDKGFWLYVPARYISKYPLTNGIPYNAIALNISLPELPVSIPVTNIRNSISELVTDMLGVKSIVKAIETSKVTLLNDTDHEFRTAERQMMISAKTTDSARQESLRDQLKAAMEQQAALETIILSQGLWNPLYIFKPTVELPDELWSFNTFTSDELQTNGGQFTLHSSTWELYEEGIASPIQALSIIQGDMFSWTNYNALTNGKYQVRVKYNVTGLQGVWSDSVDFEVVLPYVLKPVITLPDFIDKVNNNFTSSKLATSKGAYKLSKVLWQIFDIKAKNLDRSTPIMTKEGIDTQWLQDVALSYGKSYKIRVQYTVKDLEPVWSDAVTFNVVTPVILPPVIEVPTKLKVKDNAFKASPLVTSSGKFELKEANWQVYVDGVKDYDSTVPLFTYTGTNTEWLLTDVLEYGQSYQVRVQYVVDELQSVWSDVVVVTLAVPSIVKPTVELPTELISPLVFKASTLKLTESNLPLKNIKWELYEIIDGKEKVIETITNTSYEWKVDKALNLDPKVLHGVKVTYSVDKLVSVSSDLTTFNMKLPVINKPIIKLPDKLGILNTVTSSDFATSFGKFKLAKAVWSLKNLVTNEIKTQETPSTSIASIELRLDTDYELTVTYYSDNLIPVTSDAYKLRTEPTVLLKPSIIEKTLKAGDTYLGGYYVGIMLDNDRRYALIIAPKNGGRSKVPFTLPITKDNEALYTEMPTELKTLTNGLKATNALIAANATASQVLYPAANFAKTARDANLGGYNDWYIPARDEMELIYRYLKPIERDNEIRNRRFNFISYGLGIDNNGSGTNINSVPPGEAYTINKPGMTESPLYTKSGNQVIDGLLDPNAYFMTTSYVANLLMPDDSYLRPNNWVMSSLSYQTISKVDTDMDCLLVRREYMEDYNSVFRGSDVETNYGKYLDTPSVSDVYTVQESRWSMIDQVTKLEMLPDLNNTIKNTTKDTIPDIRMAAFDEGAIEYDKDYNLYLTYVLTKADGTKLVSATSDPYVIRRSKIANIEVYPPKVHISDDVPVVMFKVEDFGDILDTGATGLIKDLAPRAFYGTLDSIFVGGGVELEITNPITSKTTVVPPMSVLLSDVGANEYNPYIGHIQVNYPELTIVDMEEVSSNLGITGRLTNDWGNFSIKVRRAS